MGNLGLDVCCSNAYVNKNNEFLPEEVDRSNFRIQE